MIGKRIGGRYEIIRYIGGGGMSRVYLAHDMILDRDVAIKILNYDFSNEEELKRRFMREALSATSLTHPNIVNIYDVGEDGDHHYLVMEYVAGNTLKEYILTEGPLEPKKAIPIMEQLVSAISNAHYNGIVHRDIKPQNILMDHEGNVKITDFGIAMALSATVQTRTNSVLGTVHYLSPEQARGGMATKKSDIYALGIVFYELLTGELPFSGESAVAIALKHLQEDTPSVKNVFPEIPQSVENVILKATAKSSSDRYQSADDMLDDLSTVLSPSRAEEPMFTPGFDDDATRLIPIVDDEAAFNHLDETKKIEPMVTEQPSDVINEKAEQTEDPTTAQNKQPKKKKKWPWILSGIILLILIGLFTFVLPEALGWKKIDVPDVVDMTVDEAKTTLEEQGFKIKETIESHSDEIEEGNIIKTNPEAGKKRPKGTEFTLTVSIGKEASAVEQYIGETYDRISSLLENEGYQRIELAEEYSDEPKGVIIDQQPEAGSEVIISETDLVLTLSKGKELVTVQDLTDFTESQIEEFEKNSGLNVSISKREHSDSVPEGQVISQKPEEDAKVEKGSTIEVVLSKGEEKRPTKHIIQKVKIPYTGDDDSEDEQSEDKKEDKKKKPKPQKIKIYIQDHTHSMADPSDEFEIIKDTEVTIKIELEENERGAYRIMREDVQIEEKAFNYEDAK